MMMSKYGELQHQAESLQRQIRNIRDSLDVANSEGTIAPEIVEQILGGLDHASRELSTMRTTCQRGILGEQVRSIKGLNFLTS
jgi:hypothetical protein